MKYLTVKLNKCLTVSDQFELLWQGKVGSDFKMWYGATPKKLNDTYELIIWDT